MSLATLSVPLADVPASAAGLAEKVSIRNLEFFYGDSRALKGINLPLFRTQVTAFIGPSGCGKSTLLRVLNRMYDLYPGQRATGEVLLDGVDLREHRLRAQALRAPAAGGIGRPGGIGFAQGGTLG